MVGEVVWPLVAAGKHDIELGRGGREEVPDVAGVDQSPFGGVQHLVEDEHVDAVVRVGVQRERRGEVGRRGGVDDVAGPIEPGRRLRGVVALVGPVGHRVPAVVAPVLVARPRHRGDGVVFPADVLDATGAALHQLHDVDAVAVARRPERHPRCRR